MHFIYITENYFLLNIEIVHVSATFKFSFLIFYSFFNLAVFKIAQKLAQNLRSVILLSEQIPAYWASTQPDMEARNLTFWFVFFSFFFFFLLIFENVSQTAIYALNDESGIKRNTKNLPGWQKGRKWGYDLVNAFQSWS